MPDLKLLAKSQWIFADQRFFKMKISKLRQDMPYGEYDIFVEEFQFTSYRGLGQQISLHCCLR